MAVYKRGDVWWYSFIFAGQRIQESTKSKSKTLAKDAEKVRRRELEIGINGLTPARVERIRTIKEIGEEYLAGYRLRFKSVKFAEYGVKHVVRLLGERMAVQVGENEVTSYQSDRLREGAAPKTINEEVGFLLRLLGEGGDVLRIRLRKNKALKLDVPKSAGKAYSDNEKDELAKGISAAKSPHIRFAFCLAINAGLRDSEIKRLTWAQLDESKGVLTVGKSKTEAGEGRTIPISEEIAEALIPHKERYLKEVQGDPAGMVCLSVRRSSSVRSD